MEEYSGRELMKTFANLGVNTGNITETTLDAWFDTDCEATIELLQWLYTHLNKENVLTPLEQEEYEHITENNLVLSGKQYDDGLSQIQSDFDGILEYEKNIFQIACLEDELAMLQDEERRLEHLLNVNEKLNTRLSKQINKAVDEDIATTIEKDTAQDKTSECSSKLDELHEKLHLQVGQYSKYLQEYEHAEKPVFFTNIPTSKYDQYCADVISYLGLFLKKEELASKSETIVQSVKKNHQDSSCMSEKISELFEVILERIFKSCLQYFYKRMKESKLRAEIKFLKDLDLKDVIFSPLMDDSPQFIVEANIFSKRELLRLVFAKMENLAQQISNEAVYKTKIILSERTTTINKKKLENLNKLNLQFTEICARHSLLYLLLNNEKKNIQLTDNFFRNVHSYINTLHICQQHTKEMQEIINDYKRSTKLPLEENLKLITVINNLLSNTENHLPPNATVLDKIKALDRKQIFISNYKEHRQFTRELEQQIESRQKFLKTGPTNRIIIFPSQVLELLGTVEELLKSQESSLNSGMKVYSEAQKQLSENKWLRMRRQLWMWFFVDHQQLHIAQEQIKNAVKEVRNKTMV